MVDRNLQVPKDLDDKIALRRFLTSLVDMQNSQSPLAAVLTDTAAGYIEFTYSGPNITKAIVWSNSSKTTLLKTYTIAYSNNLISSINIS